MASIEVDISPIELQTIYSASQTPQGFTELSSDLRNKALTYYLARKITLSITIKNNFFRLLTNDRCQIRHGIIEPAMVEGFCPLDNGRHDGFEAEDGSRAPSIGLLQLLPLEIMQDVLCRFLDLETLTKVRRVSRGLRKAVDCMPQYASIVTHAPNSIRAALSLGVASYFSCRDLYFELTQDCCNTCNMFGGFLYLPTCSRVCFQCFTHEEEYLAFRQDHCQLVYDITESDLDSPDVMKAHTLPGRYGQLAPDGPAIRNRVTIIPKLSASMVGGKVHGTAREAIRRGRRKRRDGARAWTESLRRWTVENASRIEAFDSRPQKPIWSTWKDSEQNPYRYKGIMAFPWLNRITNKIEWGMGCNGCRVDQNDLDDIVSEDDSDDPSDDEQAEAIKRQNFLYCESQYLTHFLQCDNAKKIFIDNVEGQGGQVLLPEDEPACEVVSDATANMPSATDGSNGERRERCGKARIVKSEPSDASGNGYW
ncbi:hypothetical protein VTL71DRAFT_6896 [Oculimacula yallundae]|uniref:F-box domain-containing protein n=1 Tax=Oculimacula yallundae TaxID=86028 RepID=A0ABR4BWR5_9HELO